MTNTFEPKADNPAMDFTKAFEAFNLNMRGFDMPAAWREMAEKATSQSNEAYARLKGAAEGATDVLEETFETARKGAMAMSMQALEATKANTDAAFSFYRELIGAKTIADVIEVQSAFARKQFDVVSGQVKTLQETTQRAVFDAAKPTRTAVEKAFSDLKVV